MCGRWRAPLISCNNKNTKKSRDFVYLFFPDHTDWWRSIWTTFTPFPFPLSHLLYTGNPLRQNHSSLTFSKYSAKKTHWVVLFRNACGILLFPSFYLLAPRRRGHKGCSAARTPRGLQLAQANIDKTKQLFCNDRTAVTITFAFSGGFLWANSLLRDLCGQSGGCCVCLCVFCNVTWSGTRQDNFRL